jgi:hypothetical protein
LIRDLAESWRGESPTEIARKVVEYEREAKSIGRNWPRNTPILCRDLAAVVAEPEAWLDAFLQEEAPADLLEPFLRTFLDRKGRNAEQVLTRCLQSDQYVWLAVELVLQYEELRRFHEEPLHDNPDKEWAELARLALQSNYDARSIAHAAFSIAGIKVFWGSLSSLWSQRDEEFARLEEDPRAEIQEIARYGRQRAQELLEEAKAKERLEEIHGI